MLVLVDYDNVPRLRRANVGTLVGDLLAALPTASLAAASSVHFRLYGGWTTFNATVTQAAQQVSAQIQGTFPLSLLVMAQPSVRLTVTAELARSCLWNPQVQFQDTYRPRSPGQAVRGVRPASCANVQCTLHSTLAILNSFQCSASCHVSPFEGVARDEQKQVDTAIVADLIHAALNTRGALVVASSDDDMWPGIFAALSIGNQVIRIYPKSASQCSVAYEASVTAAGLSYARGQL